MIFTWFYYTQITSRCYSDCIFFTYTSYFTIIWNNNISLFNPYVKDQINYFLEHECGNIKKKYYLIGALDGKKRSIYLSLLVKAKFKILCTYKSIYKKIFNSFFDLILLDKDCSSKIEEINKILNLITYNYEQSDLNTLETISSGTDSSTYPNKTMIGGVLGAGIRYKHSSGFLVKLEHTETNFKPYDETSTTGNKNRITADVDQTATRLAIFYNF